MTDTTTGAADTPALDLRPLELGPPDPSAPQPDKVRGQAALSLAFLLGAILLAVAIVVGLIAANVVVWNLGRVHFGLVIIAGAAVIGLGKAIVVSFKRPPDDPGEIVIPEGDEPELHAMVRALADEVGTRPPDRIVMVNNVNAYVHEFGPLLGLLRGRRTLAIGAPLLDALDVSQLRAVLGHELGHFAGGDTKSGPIVYRTAQVVQQLARSLKGGLLSRMFVRLWHFQHRVTAGARRRQELIADRASVAVAGRQSTVDALARMDVTARAEAVYMQRLVGPLVQEGRRPDDLVGGMRHVLADEATVATLAAAAAADDHPGDPLDTHPPTKERIARITALAETGIPTHDHRRSAVLLRDPQRWATMAMEGFLQLAAGGRQLQPVPWSAWPDLVVASATRSQSADIDAALSRLGLPPGVAGVRAVVDTGRQRELGAALTRSGWRTSARSSTNVIMATAVRSAIASRAIDTGAEPVMSWSGEIALRAPSGDAVPLGAWVDAGLAGNWDVIERTLAVAPAPPPGTALAPPVATAVPESRPTGELPQAPSPPFVAATAPWRHEAELPNTFGGSRRWLVSDASVSIGGTEVRFDQVATFRLHVEGASLGKAVTSKIRLTTADGRTVKSTIGTMSSGKRDEVLAATMYLWDVMAAMAAPHLSTELTRRITAGEIVDVAGIAISRDGVRAGKGNVVSWDRIGDPRVDGAHLVVRGDPEGVAVAISTDNTFVLPVLIPELRALFA